VTIIVTLREFYTREEVKSLKLDEMDELLTPAMIARYMRIGRAKVYSYLRTPRHNGGIPYMKCGSHMRVRKQDFERWLNQQVDATAKPKLRAVK
jgi:excisionase family DNA binding protein